MGANVSTLSSHAQHSLDTKASVCSQDTFASSNSTLKPHHNDNSINSIGLIFSNTTHSNHQHTSFTKDNRLKWLKHKIRLKLKKTSNHAQVFRDFAQQVSTQDLAAIFDEYRAQFFVKELVLHAQSARPIASTIRNDLAELYDYKTNSDINLIYKGIDFPVHRAIVCARSPYFRELLKKRPSGSSVSVDLEIKGLRVELFNDLLKYLYTGELSGSYDARSNCASYQALIRISQECGVPNPLSHDLKYLLETGIYSDASLCFQSSTNSEDVSPMSSSNSPGPASCTCCEQTEFACHQAILAARSPFFKSFISRQQKRCSSLQSRTSSDSTTSNSLNQRIKIVLDESIIPRRVARILLHVMYRDADNLMELIQRSLCKCSVNASLVDSSSSSKESSQSILAKEIMNLYEIARFLEIDYLVQSCEDLLVELLAVDTLLAILAWSEQPHGSPWVKRQAYTFLKEEFSSIIASPTLLQLEYNHLFEVLSSDFLEAPELDILKAVVKWGEHQLMKMFESTTKDLSLLSSNPASTITPTLNKKTLKKKELSNEKLRELIGDLLDLVRIGHVIPLDCEYLSSVVVKRGLVTTKFEDGQCPPTLMMNHVQAWLRNKTPPNETFLRPRLFTPFFDECKNLLEERVGRCVSMDDDTDSKVFALDTLNQSCTASQPANCIPDNLYMVDKANFGLGSHGGNESVVSYGDLFSTIPVSIGSGGNNFHFCFTSSSASSVACYDEVGKCSRVTNMPALEERLLLLMRQREQELKCSPLATRALKFSTPNRCETLKLIQLRVVREFGLPDVAADMLHSRHSNSSRAVTNDRSKAIIDDTATQMSDCFIPPKSTLNQDLPPPPPPPPRPIGGFIRSAGGSGSVPSTPNSNHQVCDPFSYDSELKLESSSRYELESQFSTEFSLECNSHQALSDTIPDIALASRRTKDLPPFLNPGELV